MLTAIPCQLLCAVACPGLFWKQNPLVQKEFHTHTRTKGQTSTKTKLPVQRNESLCGLNRALWNCQVTEEPSAPALPAAETQTKDDRKMKPGTPAFPEAPLTWSPSRAHSQQLCTQQGKVHSNGTETCAGFYFPHLYLAARFTFSPP